MTDGDYDALGDRFKDWANQTTPPEKHIERIWLETSATKNLLQHIEQHQRTQAAYLKAISTNTGLILVICGILAGKYLFL